MSGLNPMPAHSSGPGPSSMGGNMAGGSGPSASGGARFQPIAYLGKGAQGFVQLALDTLTNQQVAIKYIDRGWSRGFYKYVLREMLNHQQLSLCLHPHIVEFYEVFLTPSYLGVVMEYVHGQNLQQYLEQAGGKLPEDVARFIFQQLIIAVDFCHKMGKVNRDIKLANILLQDGQLPLVKLCDFGFSKDKFDDSEPQTQIGTALFTAPEIFTNTQGQVYDAEAADIWSTGVVLFVMLFGQHPFMGAEDVSAKRHAQVMKLIENAVKGSIQVPPGAEHMYPEALNLIRRILVSIPSHRCKISDIIEHPWFKEKLPPGAMLLNEAYLAMGPSNGKLRQTPEEVQAMITAAVSVAGAEDRLEKTCTSGSQQELSRSESISASQANRSMMMQQSAAPSGHASFAGGMAAATSRIKMEPDMANLGHGAAVGSGASAGNHSSPPMGGLQGGNTALSPLMGSGAATGHMHGFSGMDPSMVPMMGQQQGMGMTPGNGMGMQGGGGRTAMSGSNVLYDSSMLLNFPTNSL